MTFTINSKELLKALQFAGKAVLPNAITPIFACVLLECKKSGTIMLTGSDTNTVIQTATSMSEFDMEGEESVKIAAPYDLLSKTLSSLPNAPVTITYINEGSFEFRIELMYESDLFVIPCEDPTTYFKVPVLKDEQLIEIPAQALQRGIDNVVHAASDDTLRPVITGIKLTIEPGRVEFAAMNGFVIAIYGLDIPEIDANFELIISAKTMRLISEFIGDGSENVKIKISGKHVKVGFADWVLYGLLIDETEMQFPRYRGALPTNFQHEAVVNSEQLKTAIKRATPFADVTSTTLNLSFNTFILTLSTEYVEKNLKSNQDLEIKSDIADFQIGFSAKNLLNALKTVSGDFDAKFVSSSQAVTILPSVDDGESLKYLLMPVMLPSHV